MHQSDATDYHTNQIGPLFLFLLLFPIPVPVPICLRSLSFCSAYASRGANYWPARRANEMEESEYKESI